MPDRRIAWLGIGLVAAGIILITAAATLGSRPGSPAGRAAQGGFGPGGMMGFGPGGMMGFGPGGMMGFGPGGMMGFGADDAGSAPDSGLPGFVAGTTSAPRVVRIIASGQLRFIPDVVVVQAGEAITFEVTSMGMAVHEFMVGPAADVAADTAGTPEVADIAMMQTKSLTYTFTGPGPFAFACHALGHYEAGMQGAIVVVP